jgi:hypothetical protein
MISASHVLNLGSNQEASLLPKDPFIHEKFTKERTAAMPLARKYFERSTSGKASS